MEDVPAIESPSNPLIREIARGLEDRTLLLLEGEKTILDAVSAGIPLEHVLHDASIRFGRLAALTAAQPRLVSRAVLERLSEARTPQHLLAFGQRNGHGIKTRLQIQNRIRAVGSGHCFGAQCLILTADDNGGSRRGPSLRVQYAPVDLRPPAADATKRIIANETSFIRTRISF